MRYLVSRFSLKYDNHRRYTPDFCIGDNTFIEVKGWLSNRDIDKYKRFFKDYPNLKIYLIRDENKIGNYTKFINDEISLDECEDLKLAIGG